MNYCCPHCRTTSNLHEIDCRFEKRKRHEIEEAYVGIIGNLSAHPHTKTELKQAIPLAWTPIFDAVLERLEREERVETVPTDEGDEKLRLLTPEEYAEKRKVPPYDDLRTIYEHGSVPGCHDDAVVALIAYYEMIDFSWEQTRETVTNWLRDSGTWERGGFAESSPEAVVDGKKHVYEKGYGWREASQQAAAVIEGRVA